MLFHSFSCSCVESFLIILLSLLRLNSNQFIIKQRRMNESVPEHLRVENHIAFISSYHSCGIPLLFIRWPAWVACMQRFLLTNITISISWEIQSWDHIIYGSYRPQKLCVLERALVLTEETELGAGCHRTHIITPSPRLYCAPWGRTLHLSVPPLLHLHNAAGCPRLRRSKWENQFEYSAYN